MKSNPEYNREYYLKNKSRILKKRKESHDPVRRRGWKLKHLYGLTHKEYEELFEKQKGCCSICNSTYLNKGEKYLHIDHCHKTGKVRGLLCSHCNRGLGAFKDDPALLKKAVEYLNDNNRSQELACVGNLCEV